MNVFRHLALLGLIVLFASGCGRSDDDDTAPARSILVTGATGSQGGAVARELLRRGYDVRGLTRNPQSDRARALADLDITVMKGDYDDSASLASAMQDVHGVFAVTVWGENGTEQEVAHGRQIIEAAQRAGIDHFVFTSVAEAETETGIPHFDSKYAIEQILYDSGLNFSIVRPVEFMNNVNYSKDRLMSGMLVDPRDPGESHQWIAVRDIGFFVGEMFDDPEQWYGQAINIAGDELTVGEYSDLLSECLGVEMQHQQIPWAEFEAALGEEMTLMYRWFVEPGYAVDIALLREEYPNLTTMREYLCSLGWNTSIARRAGSYR